MRASEFAELLAMIAFFGGALIAATLSPAAGSIVALVGIVWWIMRGQFLKGWIGPDYQELQDERQRLDELMENWTRPDGTEVPQAERKRVMDRRQKVARQMEQHPYKPR